MGQILSYIKSNLTKIIGTVWYPNEWTVLFENLAESLTWWVVSFSSFKTSVFIRLWFLSILSSNWCRTSEKKKKKKKTPTVYTKIFFCSDGFSRWTYCPLLLMMITLMWERGNCFNLVELICRTVLFAREAQVLNQYQKK